MKFITVTELRLLATDIVRDIENSGEAVIVTKKGKPVVLMRFISNEEFSLKEEQKGDEKKRGKKNL